MAKKPRGTEAASKREILPAGLASALSQGRSRLLAESRPSLRAPPPSMHGGNAISGQCGCTSRHWRRFSGESFKPQPRGFSRSSTSSPRSVSFTNGVACTCKLVSGRHNCHPRRRRLRSSCNAATLALNAGQQEEALRHLELAVNREPDSDHVQYMLALARAAGGENHIAVSHLQRAIELNPDNRFLARQEPKLRTAPGRRSVPAGPEDSPYTPRSRKSLISVSRVTA